MNIGINGSLYKIKRYDDQKNVVYDFVKVYIT